MEVAVKMEAMGSDGAEETIMLGRFSMVCRDSITHRARNVNQLIISTPEEQALFTMGEGLRFCSSFWLLVKFNWLSISQD
jgi:acyl-coenzyme A thioesterase 9